MKIKAKINNFSYPVIVGTDILNKLPNEINKFTKSKKVLILIDKYLVKKYLNSFARNLIKKNFTVETIKITAGKKCKDVKSLIHIIDILEKKNFSKDSTMIVVGGGTIGDLGGFAASLFFRGMHLVHVPTTLTAQIDSSLGGKVAVNFNNNINAIGNYYHPKLILCDYTFIKNLPIRDFKSGISEVIKSALITNKKYTNFIKKNYIAILKREKNIILKMVAIIIKIKLNIVKQDEREKNVRMYLNYGHTIGQAIESSYPLNLEHYRHGEAVALGMLCVAHIAQKYFKVKNLYSEHLTILKNYGLTINISKFKKSKKNMLNIILKNISKDKKKNHTGNRFVLLKQIGNPKIVSNINPNIVKESILRLIK